MDSEPGGVRLFTSSGGARIARLPLRAFPGLLSYAYVVYKDAYRILIDTGSGFGECNRDLDEGLREAASLLGGVPLPEGLTHILITHGHIDHFGGLPHLRERTAAPVGIHELDRRVLTNYEERLAWVAHHLNGFLIEAGVREERREQLMEMYLFVKQLYRSQGVDFTFGAAGMRLGPFEMLHVPGHAPGHVIIRVDDVAFGGDHILDDISPHQAPEQLTFYTGLGHYLHSLGEAEQWLGGTRLLLGGHREPIEDIPARIASIRALHRSRLQTVLDLLEEPHTIAEISKALFGAVKGYHILLALEETGAHVEYLYQRGYLCIANLSTLSKDFSPQPLRYRRQTPAIPLPETI